MEFTANKAYNIACENRQRISKGNFILSGKHLPKGRSGENLLAIAREVVYRKYEVDIYPQEFKALHRLAGDRILFTLNCMMPGWSYENLIRIMNSNPKPELEVYLNIQLFEPYSELYYIARRLKFYRVISYYRLDENGNSYIALNEQSKAFKFTSLHQLNQLQIEIPQDLYNELYERRNRTFENERKVAADNLKKAFEYRPNMPLDSHQNPPTYRAPGPAHLSPTAAQHAASSGQGPPPPPNTTAAQSVARHTLSGPAPSQLGVRQPQQPSRHFQQLVAAFQPALPPPMIPNSQPRFRFPGRGDADTVRRPSTKRGRSSSAASVTYNGRDGSFTTSPVFDSSCWNRQPPWNQYQGQQHQFQNQQYRQESHYPYPAKSASNP